MSATFLASDVARQELNRLSAHDQSLARRKPWPDTNAAPAASTATRSGLATWFARAAVATEEGTDAELAAIATAVPGGEDLAEEG
jgi:hypothetical protein